MAVLLTNNMGWIISHDMFIKNIYKKTKHKDEVKSYHFSSALFGIEIPFVRKKCNYEYDNKKYTEDVKFVKVAYNHLHELFLTLKESFPSINHGNNSLAKALADTFYCQLTRHPDSNFFGGNNSIEPLVSEIGEEFYLIPPKSLFYCYDINEISKHLNNQQFDFILMDPPWWNKYIRRKRKRNSKFGYDMVYDKDLSRIPVNSLLNQDGIIGVWCTSAPSHINAVLTDLFPAWELQFISQWFWLKVTKQGNPICDFAEPSGKQPFERIIFGMKRNATRSHLNPEENKVIMSIPSAIHSHKPPLNDLLKSYLPENPKCLEIFARYLLPGWTSYGNEVLKLQHMSLYNEEHEKT